MVGRIPFGFWSIRARSRKEIEDRLHFAHYDREVISLILYKLEKENLLDDQEFSRQWVQSRMKKYGSARITRELQMKGLDRETAESALEEYSEEDELRSAALLAEKKIRSVRSETDRKVLFRRVTGMLVRRGYSWEIARKAFDLVSGSHLLSVRLFIHCLHGFSHVRSPSR